MDARRPRKPWYRPRNLALAAIGLVLFFIVREFYIAFTAVPGARVDYTARMAKLVESFQPVPAEAPGATNAWPILLEAIALESHARDFILPNDPQFGPVPLDYSVIGDPYPMTRKEQSGPIMYPNPGIPGHTWEVVEGKTRRALAVLRGRGLFEILEQMAAAPRATRPVLPAQSPRMFAGPQADLQAMRNLARIQRARMVMAAESGDWADFAAAYDQTLALGRIAAHQGWLTDFLVGIAIQVLAHGEVRYALAERPPRDAVFLRELLASMERRPLPSHELAIRGERITLDDAIQRTHTDNGRGSGRFVWTAHLATARVGAPAPAGGLTGIASGTLANLAGAFCASRAQTNRKADEYFALLERAARAAPFERPALRRSHAEFANSLPRRYVLLRIALPALNESLGARDIADCLAAGVRVLVAVELFRTEQGRYPGSLDELAPGILPAPPIDPMSGGGYGYRLLPEGSDPFGRAYLLYSFGADGEDNGGRSAGSNQPTRALFPKGRGYDYIFNEPRHVPEEEGPQQELPEPPSQPGDETPPQPPGG